MRLVPSRSVTISPHDTNPLTERVEALYLLTAGDVVAQLRGDASDRTYTGLAANSILEGDFEFVRATGTTATMFGYPEKPK